MNLLEALEKKRALNSIIQDRLEALGKYLNNQSTLSEVLNEIDLLVDQFFKMERLIESKYNSTMLSTSESISDVISYVDGITRKIEILKSLLLEVNKKEIETGKKTDVNVSNMLTSIQRYEELKNILVKKIRDTCTETFLND